MARSYAPGQRPLIVVGTGRCGSTFLHRLLAFHDELGWLSTFNETVPRQQWLSVFSRLYAAPLPGRLKEMRAFPKPFEAYRFWESYLPGFSRRQSPQVPEEIDAAMIEPVREATRRILRFHGRDRLLVKVTGWARMAYFDRIYPDARFVFLQRDPRSVVSSWIKAGWLDVTSAPDTTSWQWGQVPEDYLAAWSDLGGGPQLSTALKIRLDLDDIAANSALLPGRVHELTYEKLITEPEPALQEICRFAELPWTPSFARTVERTEFYDSTKTWQKHLTDAEGDRVLEFMRRTDRAAA
ncbi:MAG TPA: sulfotransferase [Solirubrobacterales bacterium]|jgi:hypothetical protein|nr:sulfotransferase [Solirubrobacterales bacterium]